MQRAPSDLFATSSSPSVAMGLIDIVKKAQSLGPVVQSTVGFSALEPAWILKEHLVSHENQEQRQSRPSNEPEDLVSWRGIPSVSESVKQRIEEEERLIAAVNEKLEGSDALSPTILDGLLRASGVNKSAGKTASIVKLLKKSAPGFGPKLLNTILRACVVIGYWDAVQAMLDSNSVAGNTYPDLVSKLIESNNASLLCMWIRNVRDPRFSDLLSVLKFFLKSQRAGKSLVFVRQRWRQTALDMIARVAEMGLDKTTDADEDRGNGDMVIENGRSSHKKEEGDLKSKAVLLGVAVDEFQPSELCLHYLVASGQDEAVLASILLQLDTSEVLKLLRYLEKWLKKHCRQSILCTAPYRKKDMWIPSLAQILQWVSAILDGHYTTLILFSDFHADLRSIQLLVRELVDIGHKLAPLVGITEHIRTNGLLPVQGPVNGDEDHVIEYLEI